MPDAGSFQAQPGASDTGVSGPMPVGPSSQQGSPAKRGQRPRTWYVAVKELVGDLDQFDSMLLDFQKEIIGVKDAMPPDRSGAAVMAMADLVQAVQVLGKARDDLSTALEVNIEGKESLKPNTELVEGKIIEFMDVKSRQLDVPYREWHIKQTDIYPVERYELSDSASGRSYLVAQYSNTGDWKCLTCPEEHQKGDRHVEIAKRWIYMGKPPMSTKREQTGSAADSTVAAGYQRPYFHTTSRPVGVPEYQPFMGRESLEEMRRSRARPDTRNPREFRSSLRSRNPARRGRNYAKPLLRGTSSGRFQVRKEGSMEPSSEWYSEKRARQMMAMHTQRTGEPHALYQRGVRVESVIQCPSCKINELRFCKSEEKVLVSCNNCGYERSHG